MYNVGAFGKCVIRFSILALCTTPLAAQDPSCVRRTLPVALRGEQNLPIQNVSVADLQARVHGKPVGILPLEGNRSWVQVSLEYAYPPSREI